MTNHARDADVTAKWEIGEYGRSDAHVAVAREDESLQLDADLAMKLVSIRLPIPLIDALKAIAGHHGIAYQPMIRDLLMRFARSEFQQIQADLSSRMEEAQAADESSPPVEAFIERTRKAAGG
ncbi:hypothetical protein [Luteimonas sp. MC1750]|uniref:hypothetical protein n=1 Tax=Luteimonas sp. MC1750 TaxID=2799326 RepID=UPI0018F08348|nr:hypothetical protein [Luteimonas sp. MC1750]MBJ6984205.1 hypothetical protein [Luteimonas sp. MC1750]QQO07008.1 hypothetical protein JGR68_06215 [Luteimonas sp. MC1750]